MAAALLMALASLFAPPPTAAQLMAAEALAQLDPDADDRALVFATAPAEVDAEGRAGDGPIPLPFYVYDAERHVLTLRLHEGQQQVWDAEERLVLMLAGTQSGKTITAPPWLLREMVRRGPGDYLFVSPTFTLMELKALPEFRRLFVTTLGLGKLTSGNAPVFVLSADGERKLFGRTRRPGEPETRVLFGHAQNPESLESATAKAAVLDEAGQKRFKLESYEAIRRRLAIARGRVLFPTTPYALGWLKDLHDRAGAPGTEKARRSNVALVQFESVMNPAFSREEFEEARATMPAWKFNMMYRGRFERPAGLIYDCWRDEMKVARFPIPADWVVRRLGLDFGGVNTAAVYLAEEPGTGRQYLYRTYWEGGRTAAGHVAAILGPAKAAPTYAPDRPALPAEPGASDARRRPPTTGGAKSEGQWRLEFSKGGLPVAEPPVSEVEVGIDRVYKLISTDRLRVFDDEAAFLDQVQSYARELDERGDPTEKIEDKETYHLLDALRYIAAQIEQPRSKRRRRPGTTVYSALAASLGPSRGA